MPIAIKPGRVVTHDEELPYIKSHDPLITWSNDLDFSYTIGRFRTQMPKSSPTSFLIWYTFQKLSSYFLSFLSLENYFQM